MGETTKVSRELSQTMLAKSTQDTSNKTALGLKTAGNNQIPGHCNYDSMETQAPALD